MQTLATLLPGKSETFIKQILRIVYKFAGEPQTGDFIESIYEEAFKASSSERSEEL